MGGGNGDSGDATAGGTGGAAGDEGVVTAATAMIHIRCSNGSKFSVDVELGSTVAAFKAVLASRCDVPADQQRLIYKGRILKDEQTLASYGLESDHTIHLVRGVKSSTPSPAATTTNSGASGLPNNTPAGIGGSPFPVLGFDGLGGNRASGLFGEIPEFDQLQQQLTQNPTIMRDIMNMPAIQNLMNNPELIRNFVMNNPQMRQIIDRNPDLAHVLNDPSTLRQTLEAARNPELMREMMRNTDRAMSNIESSPEGFNMLRRMYENVQEPFLNAATMGGGDTGSDLGSNPFAALLGNQGAAQVRDNSTNSTTTGMEPTNGSPAPNTNPLPNPWNPTPGGAQPVNARSTTASDARAPGIAGLGALGLPELERAMGRMPDSSFLTQMMQNPAMMQMMQNLLSDPQYMNQILNFNPNVRNLMESNTQLREMLQNPEFIRQLMSPETMQQMLSLQQSLFSQIGQQQPREHNQTGGAAGTPNNNNGLEFLMNMFGGLGAGGFGAPNTSNVPPEELYATQLTQLQEMGFFDTQENIRALIATAGNVHAAVERLLGNPGH